MSHFNIGAFDGNNEYVRPEDAIKNIQYKCPECRKDIIFKKGKIKRAHFAHKNTENKCMYYIRPSESQKHKDSKLRLKALIHKGIKIKIIKNICKCNKIEAEVLEYKDGYKAVNEYSFTLNGLRCYADLAYVKNLKIIDFIIEVVYTHKTSECSRPEPWYEIKADDILLYEDGNECIFKCIRDRKKYLCVCCIETERKNKRETERLKMKKEFENGQVFCGKCSDTGIFNLGNFFKKDWAENVCMDCCICNGDNSVYCFACVNWEKYENRGSETCKHCQGTGIYIDKYKFKKYACSRCCTCSFLFNRSYNETILDKEFCFESMIDLPSNRKTDTSKCRAHIQYTNSIEKNQGCIFSICSKCDNIQKNCHCIWLCNCENCQYKRQEQKTKEEECVRKIEEEKLYHQGCKFESCSMCQKSICICEWKCFCDKCNKRRKLIEAKEKKIQKESVKKKEKQQKADEINNEIEMLLNQKSIQNEDSSVISLYVEKISRFSDPKRLVDISLKNLKKIFSLYLKLADLV